MFGDEQTSRPAVRDTRDLERIEQMADRIHMVCDMLEGFISRHEGAGPPKDGGAGLSPVATGYRGQIDRVHNLLNRLEADANSIVSFG